MTQLHVPTTEPEIEQPVSLPPIDPLRLMVCPRAPKDGLMVMPVTVNVACAVMLVVARLPR